VGCSYAPKGQTPILTTDAKFYTKVSVSAIITLDGNLFYDVRINETFKSMATVRLLKNAAKSFKNRLLLLWDNAAIHKSQTIKDFLQQQQDTKTKYDVYLGFIPPYSPEFNPVEQLWSYIKNVLLKNIFCKTIKELKDRVIDALESVKKNKNIITSFFRHKHCAYILN
jgi:putative transposase